MPISQLAILSKWSSPKTLRLLGFSIFLCRLEHRSESAFRTYYCGLFANLSGAGPRSTQIAKKPGNFVYHVRAHNNNNNDNNINNNNNKFLHQVNSNRNYSNHTKLCLFSPQCISIGQNM